MFASAKANLDIDADFGTTKLDQNLSIVNQNYQTLFHKKLFHPYRTYNNHAAIESLSLLF